MAETAHGDAPSELPPDGTATASSTAAGERWYALDALRAMAMLWVILGHAFLPYMDTRYGRLWAVYDRSPSASLSLIFWWMHGFRLPLFFLLAGLFAARLHASRGAAGFLAHRTKRIALPFAVGALILLPITYYVFAAGWWLSGACTWNEIRRVRFAPAIQEDVYGPVHLWFLEYLYLYCLLFWAHRQMRAGAENRTRPWWEKALASPLRPLWCALPTAAVVLADLGVVTTHRNTLVPVPLEFLHYGIFFAIGAALYRLRDDLGRLTRGGALYLGLALPLFLAVIYPSIRAHLAGGLSTPARFLLAVSLALYTWLSIFGFIGVFQALFARQRRRLAYLADAAYWIYLVHLPLVAALQIALAELPVAAELKCAVVVASTLWACLWSYERWVRYTFVGAALGARRERPRVAAAAPSSRPLPEPASIAEGIGA